jgi:hypothetical protein
MGEMKMITIKLDNKEKFVLRVIFAVLIILCMSFIAWKFISKEYNQLHELETMIEVYQLEK